MPLSFNSTEIQIVEYLFEKLREGEKDSYLYKIHKELGKSISTLYSNLEKLQQKGLIDSRKVHVPEGTRAPNRYYVLTEFGQNFAEALRTRHRIMLL